MANVVRTPIGMKDYVRNETGERQYLKLFLIFINFSVNWPQYFVCSEETDTYGMYGVIVAKNKEICGSVDSCFSTRKALLMSKRNPLVLFLEWWCYF